MSRRDPKSSRFKDILVQGCLRLAAHLPLSVCRGLGRFMGFIACRLNSRFANVTRININTCLPHLSVHERERLAKRSMVETCILALETPAIWTRDYQTWLKPRIKSVVGQELLNNELGTEQGVIVLVPHLGNWEVLSCYLAEIAPMMALYQPPSQKALEEMMLAGRERVGAALVPTNTRGVAKLLKHLKGGGMTAILPDQVPRTNGGEFAPFFERPAYTMTLVQSLRTRTDCRLIACYAERVAGGFNVVFKAVDADLYSDDNAKALLGLNKTVEACVLDVPEQYQWEYKRFRGYPRDGSVEKLY